MILVCVVIMHSIRFEKSNRNWLNDILFLRVDGGRLIEIIRQHKLPDDKVRSKYSKET